MLRRTENWCANTCIPSPHLTNQLILALFSIFAADLFLEIKAYNSEVLLVYCLNPIYSLPLS